jgi:hypothetical protein
MLKNISIPLLNAHEYYTVNQIIHPPTGTTFSHIQYIIEEFIAGKPGNNSMHFDR